MNPALKGRIEEYLNDTKDITDLTAQKRHNLLRLSRGLAMEMLTFLEPKPDPNSAARPQNRDTNVEGLTSHQTPIFNMLIDEPGVLSAMVSAMETAKKMGVLNFAIQLKEETTSQPRRHPNQMFNHMMFGLEQETWNSASRQTYRLTIFAETLK